jgi:hypothetical protein
VSFSIQNIITSFEKLREIEEVLAGVGVSCEELEVSLNREEFSVCRVAARNGLSLSWQAATGRWGEPMTSDYSDGEDLKIHTLVILSKDESGDRLMVLSHGADGGWSTELTADEIRRIFGEDAPGEVVLLLSLLSQDLKEQDALRMVAVMGQILLQRARRCPAA